MQPSSPLISRISRRQALASVALATGAAALGRAARAQEAEFSSGALGLSRPEIDAQWGPGERVTVPGHPIYDETYVYAAQGWKTYVWYMSLNEQEVAAYVEVDYGPDGVPPQQAHERVTIYLPADAEFSELFVAPATPGGPTALSMTRYLSPSLAAAHGNSFPPEILVTLHESWRAEASQEDRVTAISLMARMVIQQG